MLNDDDAKAVRGLVTLEPGAAAGPIAAAEYRRCRIDEADYLFALAGSGDFVLDRRAAVSDNGDSSRFGIGFRDRAATFVRE